MSRESLDRDTSRWIHSLLRQAEVIPVHLRFHMPCSRYPLANDSSSACSGTGHAALTEPWPTLFLRWT